jgi:8-amino-7-oxononanoate synthase
MNAHESAVNKFWEEKLRQQKAAGLWRTHQGRGGPQPVQSFNSNDYLGLSNHPEVIRAFKAGADQYGVGSGSANTLSGYTQAHEALRASLRDWLQREEVILFSSGYQANLAVLTTLIQQTDHVFADKLNHASLIDGMLFSGAPFSRYPHLDLEKLDALMERRAGETAWIVTESLFSMNGDTLDLPGLSTLCQKHGATPIIDEAHSLGLMGPEGSGMIRAAGFTQQEFPLMIGTFGKSLGTQGAFVAGDKTLIEALIQFARPYLFTTAMAPALAMATEAAIRCARAADQERAHLQALIIDFRSKATALGLDLLPSNSPIQPIIVNQLDQINRISARLQERGILIAPIRYPTVPMDSPRLRITLRADHTPEMISQFLDQLREVIDETTSDASRL